MMVHPTLNSNQVLVGSALHNFPTVHHKNVVDQVFYRRQPMSGYDAS